MKSPKNHVYLPLTHALGWIVASTLLISGTSYALMKRIVHRQRLASHEKIALCRIIQTGPQKQALKTEYLAELLGLSRDFPQDPNRFDVKCAQKRLLSSPLIKTAYVKLIKPETLYIDYTVRQPIAWIEDYDNVVFDKEGFLFPFNPFFTPKNLPAIYFGLGPFGQPSSDPAQPSASWGVAMQGKCVDLALNILDIVTDPKVAGLFSVKRIDVSNAFAQSYGTREIVVITEDTIVRSLSGKEIQLIIPRILRLSTKNYAKELGNYLLLRTQLLEEERNIPLSDDSGTVVRLPQKMIDFRIQKLAFVE